MNPWHAIIAHFETILVQLEATEKMVIQPVMPAFEIAMRSQQQVWLNLEIVRTKRKLKECRAMADAYQEALDDNAKRIS